MTATPETRSATQDDEGERGRKVTTPELEYAVAQYIGIRTHLIVPNVSWGFLNNYEADLLVVTRARYLWVIEL